MSQVNDSSVVNNDQFIDLPVHLRVRKYIKSKGYVIRVIAEKSGIDEKRFYKIMTGKSRLTADDLEKICFGGLSVEPSYFFENKFSEIEN
ncbi:transcriptional regulator with XRE-family HTH domain [Paenibacillus sp. 4624]|uniref:helix-turn-helix domain-containing protein n=1 Tax=Paenibacillus sp. 4624 TaxID=3156453 RepID=UPI003D247763